MCCPLTKKTGGQSEVSTGPSEVFRCTSVRMNAWGRGRLLGDPLQEVEVAKWLDAAG